MTRFLPADLVAQLQAQPRRWLVTGSAGFIGSHLLENLLKAGQQARAEDLQMHVKNALAPYKYPRWIEFVPELPKTATGKIQRFKLRAANAA